MKKFLLFGTSVFLVGLFTSLVNGPIAKQDQIFNEEIEALMASADVKIKSIKDISKSNIASNTNFNKIILYSEK